jgi:hypothetical protein
MISNDESALTETEVHYLQSDNVGEEFKILVGPVPLRPRCSS